MASRVFSFLTLTAIGGLVLMASGAPATADEDPYRAPAPRYRAGPAPAPHHQRVRTVERVRTVVNTRTVWRTRTVCFDYTGQPFDCRHPAPVQPQIIGYTVSYQCGGCGAPIAPPVQYYAPVAAPCGTCAPAVLLPPQPSYSSCGNCAQPAPYAAPYRYSHRHRHRGHPIVYGYAAQ